MDSTKITAQAILDNVEKCIEELDGVQGKWWAEIIDEKRDTDRYIRTQFSRKSRYAFNMNKIYKELSIFDWWNSTLSKNQLLEMRKFLKEAIKLGYTGYVCFKVGATGCANGMWAHKELSTTGYSPKGACIYKSFSPDYNYWSITLDGDNWFPKSDEHHKGYDSCKTIKEFETFLRNI